MNNIYTHNWYDRNINSYVYGPSILSTGTYSDKIFTSDKIKTMLNNYNLLALNITDMIKTRFNVNVNITITDKEEGCYTDGRNIVLEGQKQIQNNAERLDVILGCAFHEVAHCLYTDFKYIKNKHIYCNPILNSIHNILEDEEIENRVVKRNIGYGKYIAKIKQQILANAGAGKAKVLKKRVNNLDEILTIFFCLIRYPKYMGLFDTAVLDKHADLFIKINNILINTECPAAAPLISCDMRTADYYDKKAITPTTVQASFEIYKYIQEYLQEDFEQQKKECEENENSFINQKNIMPVMCPVEGDGEKINGMIDSAFGCPMIHDDVYMGDENGATINTTTDKCRFPNPSRYNVFFNQMKQYVSLVQKTVIPTDMKTNDVLDIRRFSRNGNLDTNRLAEAMQNINTIYNQRVTIKKPSEKTDSKYAFVIMMDESGSMKTYDRRNEFSVKTAILFYEALSKFPGIEIYVYGHGDKINPYITKEHKNKYVLGNFDQQCSQNDEYSYNWIINDVKRQTNLPIVVLNITDFYYCSSDTNMRKLFDVFRKSNVSFNMLNIGTKHTKREIEICKNILDGQVVSLTDINNSAQVTNAFKQLSLMIADNYKRFNRK